MTDLLRDRFYWLGMQNDSKTHINTFKSCIKFKTKPECVPYMLPVGTLHMLNMLNIVHRDLIYVAF